MELAFAVLVVCAAHHDGSRRQGRDRHRTSYIFSFCATSREGTQLFKHRSLVDSPFE